MRFLFCCEFYYPSIGGVQEVMRQIAERMVQRGHDVTIATSALPNRKSRIHNGVKIEEFKAAGNLVSGLRGEIQRYQEFVLGFDADAVLVKAAQQWSFDALWPILAQLRSRKIFIPCGFSGLFHPSFSEYYNNMIRVLSFIDHFIFYAENYRDISFVREAGFRNISVIPNGACEREFADAAPDVDLRATFGIDPEAFVFLSVGSLTGLKGHAEIIEAFATMETGGAPVALILNGNRPAPPAAALGPMRYVAQLGGHLTRVLREEGLWAALGRMKARLTSLDHKIHYWKNIAVAQAGKQVFLTNLSRSDLVDAYKTADLFVFASNIEYSPLVLYESVAAATPFLSVPVGNAEEIARRTGAGLICPASVDERGFTRVKPRQLADAMTRAMNERERLKEMGRRGREAWTAQYTWQRIAEQYEAVLCGRDPLK